MRIALASCLGCIVLAGSSDASAKPVLRMAPEAYRIERVSIAKGRGGVVDITVRAAVTNHGSKAIDVTADVLSAGATAKVLDGHVSFGNVGRTWFWWPARSRDTFKIRFTLPRVRSVREGAEAVERMFEQLTWHISCRNCQGNQPPIAHAGADRTARVGEIVELDGSGSADKDGDALTFRWKLISRPKTSRSKLAHSHSPRPQLNIDAEGTYVAQLVVSDGRLKSAPATVTVTTNNSAPVANAGQDQSARVGARVVLDGSRSSDADGDALTYEWSLVEIPEHSAVRLLDADPASPLADFEIDRAGRYVAQLVVNDGSLSSEPDVAIVSTLNTPPVANAGPDVSARVGQVVQLTAELSSDVDGDALTFRWSLSTPEGSTASLTATVGETTSFTTDVPGTYVVQLTASDAEAESEPDTVAISTVNSRPVAQAEPSIKALVGESVVLDGSASADADGDALSFSWSLLHVPLGSTAQLEGRDTPRPSFVPDAAGLYVVQLIVSDGPANSDPAITRVTAMVRDTQPPAAVQVDSVTVTAVGDSLLRIQGAAQTVESRAWVRVTNGRTGESVTVRADESGAFEAQLEGTESDELVLTVIDDAQNESDPVVLHGSRDEPLSIELHAPAAGAVVEGASVLVQGVVRGPLDAGISVNGIGVPILESEPPRSFAASVWLWPGENVIDVAARRPDGTSVSEEVHVVQSGTPLFGVEASPVSGVVPFEVMFEVVQLGAARVSVVRIDADGDGTFDVEGGKGDRFLKATYDAPGAHIARVNITATDGESAVVEVPIVAQTLEQADQQIQRTWQGMASALAAGDRAAALTYFTPTAAERYAPTFEQLGEALPAIAAGFSQIVPIRFDGPTAEYSIVRSIDGIDEAFLICFLRGQDGLWRISSL
ncbi:MAG TPA: PKD domain-containing protein [Steroidobacter sp.]